MLLAELERLEPDLILLLRRRAAAWYLRNGLHEEALEYSIAAGDVDEAARLVQELWLPTDRQGRTATLRRWFRWLDDRGRIEGHPMLAVQAGDLAGQTGRPAEAERWADAVDRWQYQDGARPSDPSAEAWAAVLRAVMCRRGVGQMRADADEAARKLTAAGVVAPVAPALQGLARVLCGDPESGDAFFEDAIGMGEVAAPDVLAGALCERSLLAMAHGDWGQAEAFAGQARSVLRRAGAEDALVSAVQARVALHRGDLPTVRQELTSAQRLRPLLTYAQPHLAVQVRIELVRVLLALADLAGARTLMREIDELFKRRPGLGTLAGPGRDAAGPDRARARLRRPRGVGTDRCRVAPAAVAVNPSVVRRGWRRTVPLG
jgi:LuxR family transcriptional regulator, maltose regulon positive regulatory protein